MTRWTLILTLCAFAASAAETQLDRAQIGELTKEKAQVAVAELQQEQAKDRQDALADFKRGAGLGISVVMGDEESIDEAAIVDGKVVVTRRAQDHVRASLEIHQLLTGNIFTTTGRAGVRKQIVQCGKDPSACPLFGVGPFAAIQVADDNAISSAGVGLMFGVRSDPRHESSFNVGVGVVWDNRVKHLATGFVEGKALPAGETAIRFTETSSRRLMLTLSFAF